MNAHREIESIFKALANTRRMAVFNYLASVKKQSVGEIAKKLKISIHATSRHLMQLYRAGIIEREQVSLVVYYSLNHNNPIVRHLRSLVANLTK